MTPMDHEHRDASHRPLFQDDGTGEAEGVWLVDWAMPEYVRDAADTLDLENVINMVVERCAQIVFPRHSHDKEFSERLRVSVSQNAYSLREVLAGRLQLPDLALDQVISFAKVQAHLRIPQMSMHRSYRVSFFLQWEIWTAHLRAHIERVGLSRDQATEALSCLTRVLLSYQDHVASHVAETYTRDYEALSRSRTHVRHGLIRDILRGEDGSLTASDLAILAYPMEAHHVAVILPTMPEDTATRFAEGLRSAADAHGTLLYPLGLSGTAVWLCRHSPWNETVSLSMRKVLEEAAGISSISSAERGIEGFRNTLMQAEEAERVRAAWGPLDAPRVISYVDAGLEVLLLHNEELARTFMEHELGPLAEESTEAARLRQTLEASFRYDSHVATAEHLKLHEHTVRNRLRKAEEILRHPLHERRTELQVAMRLLRLLGGTSEREGS